MNTALQQRILSIRERLSGSGNTAGYFAPGSTHASFPAEVPTAYQEFLRQVDGAVCGVVLLYGSDGLSAHQVEVKGLSGGRARWFCFGAVEDYPLVLDRPSGAVYLVPDEGPVDEDSSLGELDYFLLTSVFGAEYADFVVDAESDPWYQLVRSL